jgi:hypothetical protein
LKDFVERKGFHDQTCLEEKESVWVCGYVKIQGSALKITNKPYHISKEREWGQENGRVVGDREREYVGVWGCVGGREKAEN